MNTSTSRIDGDIGDPAVRFRELADRLRNMGAGVPHEAANIPCYQALRKVVDPETRVEYTLHCKKRAGHDTPKGEEPHVAEDFRIVASPRRVVHTERFKPNTMPAGIDMSITIPHDCDNHLRDVADLTTEAYLRGR